MRTRRPPLPTVLALVLALATGSLAALTAAPEARASHYLFTRIELVTPTERRALARAGIFDTNLLLGWTASVARRSWLADTTAIPFERLSALATMCDLLRIEGVGPVMVEALQKAGMQDSQVLAASRPKAVLDRLRVVTRGTSVASRLPDEDTVRTWIAAAARLRPILEDTPTAEPLR